MSHNSVSVACVDTTEDTLGFFTGDHIFGIGPLLAGCLNGLGGMIEGVDDKRTKAAALQNIEVSSIALPYFVH